MIIILTDIDEPTTDLVIDWLNFYNKEFVRISSRDPIEIKEVYWDSQNQKVEVRFISQTNKEITLIDTAFVASYWYRRSNISVKAPLIGGLKPNKEEKILNIHVADEYKSVGKILNNVLNRKKRINKVEDNKISKINVLEIASECGLNIPDFIICSSKKTLLPFYEKYVKKGIITKDIGDPIVLYHQGMHIFTSLIDINQIPEHFGLSLFQECIDKFVELRIFFIKDKIFSSAIFSQLDKQTEVDFKNYNDEKPNRVIPYNLPHEIEEKLRKFMKKMDLNCGSIDLVLTKDLKYIFLEVNPIGQFEQVSIPCNYNLFKVVAELL